jgi:hypothetical protein
MEQPISARRRDQEWGPHLSPEQRSAVVPFGCINQCLGHEAKRVQDFPVGAQGRLVFGTTLQVLEHESGYPAPGNLAKIRDVQCAIEIAVA